MAVEIRILSGAREGERIVLEGTEFQIGDDSNCRIFFDPRVDESARGRSVLLRLASDGWRIESTGAGEVLLNQTAVVKQTPIRSGDLVRLSEFGPDFSFTVTSLAADVVDSAVPVSKTAAETPSAGRANGVAEPDSDRDAAVAGDVAAAKSPPPLPESHGQRWKLSIRARAAVAATVVVGVILLGLADWSRTDNTADRGPVALMPAGPGSTDLDQNSGVDQIVPPEQSDDPPEPPDDPPEPPDDPPEPPDDESRAGSDTDDPPTETPEEKPPVEKDPWPRVKRELPAALFIIQAEMPGDEERASLPFCTGIAIDDHTILSSAREVLVLAGFRRKGLQIWAVNPATGLKTAVRTLRVPRRFADSMDRPGDLIYLNLGLLVTEAELPMSGSPASPDDLQDLKSEQSVACFGFPCNTANTGRIAGLKPELSRGEIIHIHNSLGLGGSSRLLVLTAKIAENMCGSPIFNERGEVVAVYCDPAVQQDVGMEDLHYATVLDHALLRSWIEKMDGGRWVAPPDIERP